MGRRRRVRWGSCGRGGVDTDADSAKGILGEVREQSGIAVGAEPRVPSGEEGELDRRIVCHGRAVHTHGPVETRHFCEADTIGSGARLDLGGVDPDTLAVGWDVRRGGRLLHAVAIARL